ncbi:MAG: hypothetical protein EI684_22665 [Candidatus Viridilinea halotolerans]|uniref:ScoMcrA-like DNA sulfur-binding domain-containing protein n=1 Tax=Candidatus Viridilinea halotolerans TaxID=2491704 RepID=A0A426TQL9_9CHLR|nr:MAG: hypothetical protein EI684_22665 [Candidatus Viridilinea halotolerans]
MNDTEKVFLSIKIWRSKGQVALHKPLLLLYALWMYRQNHERMIPYKKIDSDLAAIVQELQIMSRPFRAYYPFWRLQNDDIWEVEHPEFIRVSSQGDAWKNDLDQFNPKGGVTVFIFTDLKNNNNLSLDISERIIQKFFDVNDRKNIQNLFKI